MTEFNIYNLTLQPLIYVINFKVVCLVLSGPILKGAWFQQGMIRSCHEQPVLEMKRVDEEENERASHRNGAFSTRLNKEKLHVSGKLQPIVVY